MNHHHLFNGNCRLCDQKLLNANVKLRIWFLDKVKPKYPNFHISWSYRNAMDQQKAFDEGKSKLLYPRSAHNKTDILDRPCSRALDLFELTPQNEARFPIETYRRIAASLNPEEMTWGGFFKNFPDYDHYELI